MKSNYLFPHQIKKMGWIMVVPAIILGFISMEYSPDLLDINVFSLWPGKYFGVQKNNIFDEISAVLIILSLIFVAFSKEKEEDELISKLRLESLVWATYVNYAILVLAFVLVYDYGFFTCMIFNLFTILIFFIIRFNLQVWRLKKSETYEE